MQTLIDKSKGDTKVTERRVRVILATIFMLAFLVSLGYFIYQTWLVYSTPADSLTNIGDIAHYIGHNLASFEAAILSFLLFVASLKI